jgi:hypothetical protein
MDKIIRKAISEKSYSFREYRDMTENLLSEGKTTGPDQSEAMIEYTKLNNVRMNRIEKTTTINEQVFNSVSTIERKQLWLAISEPWCGDAANIVPVLSAMAEINDKINFRIILREENPETMDRYLTNGGRAIPMLIIFDVDSGKELAVWGPRPAALQKIINEMKKKPDYQPEELKKTIQLWYAENKTKDIQEEILSLVKISKNY